MRDGEVSEGSMKERTRKRNQTWKVKLAKIQEAPPPNVAASVLNLTICVCYWQTLLRNPGVNRYLSKYHQHNLRKIQNVLTECS